MIRKLAAIYNVFDGVELLKGSMNTLKDHVDVFVLVVQDVSNYGETFDGFKDLDLSEFNTVVIHYNPDVRRPGHKNEAAKRNLGIQEARNLDCSHFIQMDCDEYFQDFGAAKQAYLDAGFPGSVCPILTYFKRPEFRLKKFDNYYVPFIHQLHSDTITGASSYPYYVDPTRRINQLEVVLMDHPMHHFSWIRKDIAMKVRNSSAKHNIEKSKLLEDYWSKDLEVNPEGFFLKDFDQKVTVVENIFGIDL
jgi:hypothetical protein